MILLGTIRIVYVFTGIFHMEMNHGVCEREPVRKNYYCCSFVLGLRLQSGIRKSICSSDVFISEALLTALKVRWPLWSCGWLWCLPSHVAVTGSLKVKIFNQYNIRENALVSPSTLIFLL